MGGIPKSHRSGVMTIKHTLSDEELEMCCDMMVQVDQFIRTNTPENQCMKHFRQAICQGKIKLSASNQLLFDKLRNWEERIIGRFAGVAIALSAKWTRGGSPLDQADLYQEGLIKIYDSIYSYNGTSKFVTFVTCNISRRFFEIQSSFSLLSSMDRKISENRYAVSQLMDQGMTWDTAVEELGIDPETRHSVRQAMVAVRQVSQISKWDVANFLNTPYVEKQSEMVPQKITKAVEEADLSAFERDVLAAYMCGEKGAFQSTAKRHINPATGKIYSRMAAKHAFERAIKKIKKTYEVLRHAA